MRASTLLFSVALGFSFVVLGACGGDSTDGDDNGGKILDSGNGEDSSSQHPDAGGPETEPGVQEAGVDVVVPDVAPDHSVEPEASVPDAEIAEGGLFDLTMPDVVLGEGGTLQDCYDCSVDNCTSDMEKCDADAKCRTILLCIFEEQCLGGPNGLDYACGLGCATKAGISGLNDPAVGIAIEAANCVSKQCGDECGLPADGGLPIP
jgi:hypothetical protein